MLQGKEGQWSVRGKRVSGKQMDQALIWDFRLSQMVLMMGSVARSMGSWFSSFLTLSSYAFFLIMYSTSLLLFLAHAQCRSVSPRKLIFSLRKKFEESASILLITLSVWLVITRAIKLLSIGVPICCSKVALPILLIYLLLYRSPSPHSPPISTHISTISNIQRIPPNIETANYIRLYNFYMNKKRKVITDIDDETFTPAPLLNLSQHSPQSLPSNFPSPPSTPTPNYPTPGPVGQKDRSNSLKLQDSAQILMKDGDLKRGKIRHNLPHQRLNQLNGSVEQEECDKMGKKERKKSETYKFIFQSNNILEGIIKGQKIKKLQKTFARKIGRTSTAVAPVQFDLFSQEGRGVLSSEGIEVSPLVLNVMNLVSVCQIVALLFVYSVSLVFSDLIGSGELQILQVGSMLFYSAEIVVNLVSIKSEAGRRVTVIREIIEYYMNRTLWIDVAVLLVLVLDVGTNLTANSYLRLCIVLKLPECLNKVEKLEVYFIRNIYNEQYWEFAKVFVVNFCIAHAISILLAAMSKINPQSNWMLKRDIADESWTEQYTWSYYWAANIMLTVGFGDMVATNSSEAICLIFIETFSCIVMAYNINCMGGIISNLRCENAKRSKKFKIFKKLADQNFVPEDLEFQINNYIEESSNLKKIFNYEEEKEFMNELPEALRVEYLKESNHKILKELVFFRDLLDRTLYNFAERLEIKITHPQQIIRNLNSDFNLMILKEGEIGYVCKKNGFEFNNEIVDLIKVRAGEAPFLTGLDFISKVRPQYEIKSLKFSVLYQMEYNRFIEIFKESDMDYELFCFLRDKIRNIPDQFEVLPCEFCSRRFNHFKFTCPKLHYAPFEQHVIDKELHKEKIGRNSRRTMDRFKKNLLTPIEYYSKLNKYRQDERSECRDPERSLSNQFYSERPRNHRRSLTLVEEQTSREVKMSAIELEQIIDSKTREIIEMQFLRKARTEGFEDEIWSLSLDTLQDFNSYFSQNNPHLLNDRFNPLIRQNKKLQKFSAIKLLSHQMSTEGGQLGLSSLAQLGLSSLANLDK